MQGPNGPGETEVAICGVHAVAQDLCNVYKVLLTVSDVRFLRIGRHGRHLGDVKLHEHSRDMRWKGL